ncbi:hypothetical protein [Aliiroseovarius crassostreae]|uniref:hypothetical protein n=1 Tax=Aliiroseovarius crassostreae TaxID=154981 RepID=UPI0021FE8DFC|nr:hypothetical protein [Aliiroseovarius crassostreae]UWP98998.1 hypothetical protein K3X53_02190 [Aliiroseovarius crassostreae]
MASHLVVIRVPAWRDLGQDSFGKADFGKQVDEKKGGPVTGRLYKICPFRKGVLRVSPV